MSINSEHQNRPGGLGRWDIRETSKSGKRLKGMLFFHVTRTNVPFCNSSPKFVMRSEKVYIFKGFARPGAKLLWLYRYVTRTNVPFFDH